MRSILFAAIIFALAGCGDTTYVFDDVGVGGDEQGRAPRERTNGQFVRAAYADLVGRTPESYEFVVSFNGTEAFRFPLDEQEVLLASLDAVGDPAPMRSLIIAGLLESDETDVPVRAEIADPAEFIREQFRFLLGREPGVYELQAFVTEWRNDPNVNPRTVIRALMESREYQTY